MFVCSRCKREEPDPYRQFSERLEYRRLDCKARPASFTTRLVCLDCVNALAELHAHGGLDVAVVERDVPVAQQAAFL